MIFSFLLPAKAFPKAAPPVMSWPEIETGIRRLADQDPTFKAFMLLLHTHWVQAVMEGQRDECKNRDYWAGRAAGLAAAMSHIENLRGGAK